MPYAFVFMLALAANPIDDFMRPGGRARVIAHRGFSGVAPENTIAALSGDTPLAGTGAQ